MKIIFAEHIEMIETEKDWYEIHLVSWKWYCFSWENIQNCKIVSENECFWLEDYINLLNKYGTTLYKTRN